jgi:hypothetical protein
MYPNHPSMTRECFGHPSPTYGQNEWLIKPPSRTSFFVIFSVFFFFFFVIFISTFFFFNFELLRVFLFYSKKFKIIFVFLLILELLKVSHYLDIKEMSHL